MRKQIVFGDETVNKYYLSPYTDLYIITERKILMKRCDTGKQILLTTSSRNSLDSIINNFENGLDNLQIIELFENKDLVVMLLEIGVIE